MIEPIDPASVAKREAGKIWNAINEVFNNRNIMEAAVAENLKCFEEFTAQMAMVYEERLGFGFDEITQEDRADYAKMLAGAVVDLVSELDPDRLRCLAAGMIGVSLADVDKPSRGAIWRAIKQTDPAALVLLCSYLRQNHHAELYASIPVSLTTLPGRDITMLESRYATQLASTGCLSVESYAEVQSDDGEDFDSQSYLYYTLTSLGSAVLKTLVPYLVGVAESTKTAVEGG
jgi:hypothetical protein